MPQWCDIANIRALFVSQRLPGGQFCAVVLMYNTQQLPGEIRLLQRTLSVGCHRGTVRSGVLFLTRVLTCHLSALWTEALCPISSYLPFFFPLPFLRPSPPASMFNSAAVWGAGALRVGDFSKAGLELGSSSLATFLMMVWPNHLQWFINVMCRIIRILIFFFYFFLCIQSRSGGLHASMLKWVRWMQSRMSGPCSSSFKDLFWRRRTLSCGLLCFPHIQTCHMKIQPSIPAIMDSVIQLFMAWGWIMNDGEKTLHSPSFSLSPSVSWLHCYFGLDFYWTQAE